MKKYYAGIGSRETPKEICDIMTQLAGKLEEKGWVLRSGLAKGADQAFSSGVKRAADIFLPWRNFELGAQMNNNQHNYFWDYTEDYEAIESVDKFHPAPQSLSSGARQLMTRNFRQIVGRNEPNSSFVVCWTVDGTATGGTGQALRIAQSEIYKIPIFNLQKSEDLERIKIFLND